MSDVFTNWEEQQEFEAWAFGAPFLKYDLGAIHTWNSLHGEHYFVREDEMVDASVRRMLAIWKKETQTQSDKNEEA
jgi:hypothetical protein